MVVVIVSLATAILLAVSGLHLYWASGGRWGGAAAVPRKADGGELLFKPRVPETVAVALLLLVAAAALLVQADLIIIGTVDRYAKFACILCAVVFFVRAVGEFKYLGLFKRIRNTAFGRNDTLYYSPMCLFLALAYVLALLG
ncbi:DUF3995 domain-containing protein [Cohnella sp. GCM10027633]|uniref:DUF3995 domain-containing protein n=1 Tax=unclassified Cohnella TaxID=2636738 RepID=UPI00362A9A2A